MTINDRVTMARIQLATKKGYQLGATATWKKLKSTALAKDDPVGYDGNSVDFGANDELVLTFGNHVEIWFKESNSFRLVNQFLLNFNADVLHLVNFKLIHQLDQTYRILVILKNNKNDYNFQIHQLKLNLSDSGQQGSEIIKNLIIPPANLGNHPFTIKCSPKYLIISSIEGKLSIFGNDMVYDPVNLNLVTESWNHKPIFDIMGNWIVFTPKDNDVSSIKSCNEKLTLTSIKLPPQGPILARVLSNLSDNAIDGVIKLSEASSRRVRNYFNNEHSTKANDTYINFIQKTLTKLLYQAKSLNSEFNQLCVIMNLQDLEVLSLFKPPGGLSSVSLSPFDLTLSSTNRRGNNMYIWDLTKINQEISLIGKFSKGKTPSLVNQVIWLNGNEQVGFITKSSGSLHWFDINKSEHSWMWSSLRSTQLHISNDRQIYSIDQNRNLLVIDPSNGEFSSKFEIPMSKVSSSFLTSIEFPREKYDHHDESDQVIAMVDPLSQVEIETCYAYPNLYNNCNFKIAQYIKTDEHGDDEKKQIEEFLGKFSSFGNDLDVNDIAFSVQIQHDESLLGDLVIDQGNDSIE